MTDMPSPVRSPVAQTVHPLAVPGALSVGYVIVAALLIGAGLFLVFVWITSFQWLYFSGIFLLAIGLLMLFSPRAGADRAA